MIRILERERESKFWGEVSGQREESLGGERKYERRRVE